MTRYWLVVGGLMALLLVLFGVGEALGVFADPAALMQAANIGAATAGILLLVVDVVLPVPSSLVMILNGALFGALVGASLSLVGGTGAAVVGFAIGRRGEALLQRWVPPAERQQADTLLRRWGVAAITITRPLPLLAETTVIMAGASSMTWRQMVPAAVVGVLPTALLYGIAGATAATFGSLMIAFSLTLVTAALIHGCTHVVKTYIVEY